MNRLFVLTGLLFFNLQLLVGQVNNISFRQISPPGGFTLKSIHKIKQDKLGYIWMATNQGLIRYDSKNTVWFIPSVQDSSSICSEEVNDILVDSDNIVWVATNNGLCSYERQKQSFVSLDYSYEDGSSCNKIVFELLIDAKNRPIVLDEQWVGILDKEKRQLNRIAIHEINSPSHIYLDFKNQLWIGTHAGDVYIYSFTENRVQKIISGNTSSVNAIYTEDHSISVGFETEGVKKYDKRGVFQKQYSFNQLGSSGNFKGSIRTIKRDTYGRVWYAAYEGLFLNDGNRIIQFKPDDYPGLPHNSIFDVFEDSQGGIWIGTWAGGVALFHHSDNNFSTYQHSKIQNSVSDNKISSFAQLSKNEILVGTEVGGLNAFNIDTRMFSKVNVAGRENIENIKSLSRDKHGGIWVGSYRKGLWYRAPNTTKYIHFKKGITDGAHLTSESVYSICPVDSGVWIASYPVGLDFYSFEKKRFSYTLKYTDDCNHEWDKSIHCIYLDSKSNLWLGTIRGAYKVDLSKKHVEKIIGANINSCSENRVIYEIKEISSGDIWFGSKNNGVIAYNLESEELKTFNGSGLLSGKDVYGLIEGGDQKLWVTSNNGLICHDFVSNTNKHFVYADGIQSNLFSPQAVFEDSRGSYYLGGANGFTVINPNNIKSNIRKPFTIINEVFLNDTTVIYPKYKGNSEYDGLTFKAKENTFTIKFAADNYLMPEKNRYKYRLVNNYDKWIDIQNEGYVLFADLRAGEYVFEVKACNNDGVWNEVPTRLAVVIEANWYQTIYAYSVYLILFVLSVYLVSHSFIERMHLRRNYILEKNQRENEEEINEMKLKFFTNISHEFRTPLTLISWPLKKLLQASNITEEQREELEVVQRNSSRLLQLIEQLIDFRKQEKAKLVFTKFDLVPFVLDIQKGFALESKSKQIEFVLDTELVSCMVVADKDKLDMVLYNLVSNAYKYCKRKGKITLSIALSHKTSSEGYKSQLSFGKMESSEFIEVAIEDTGSGIESEDLLKIFNRFEQGRASKTKIKGSGIGLSICKEYTLLHNGEIIAQSTPDNGSRFTLRIPLHQTSQEIMFESHHEVKNLQFKETQNIPLRVDSQANESCRILVVEDNDEFRSFISIFLNSYYQVDTASNGEQALQKMKNGLFDVVVSDVMMPKMDGYELCRIIKTKLETSHVPVILLTALSSVENHITGLDIGADAYLTKPFEEEILLRQIQNILQQRNRIRENFNKQFISNKTVEVGTLDNFFLNRVRSVIEKNISDEYFRIESLAEELSISRSQLHRKIKSLSGHTTSDFVNLVRIKKAVELIEKENYSFNEVSFHVGFSSQSYFTKCFKKVYQKTPKEYFANLRKNS